MTQKPKINIKTYDEAMRFLTQYGETRRIMSPLIEDFMPEDSEMVLSCSDLDQLKYHCWRMRGLSEKILKSHPIASNILKLQDASTPGEYELLDERVCIQLEGSVQLEGISTPDDRIISQFYQKVKSQRAESN